MEQEEKAMMSTTAGANTVWKRQNERLEKRLRALNGLEAQFEENVTLREPETLVTKLVALEEVRNNFSGWREALLAEHNSLMQCNP